MALKKHCLTYRTFFNIAAILATLAAPLFILWCIIRYGVSNLYWDEWNFVPLLVKVHNGQATFTDFWQGYNGHRLAFPRLALSFLAKADGSSPVYVQYLAWCLGILKFLVIISALWLSLRKVYELHGEKLTLSHCTSIIYLAPLLSALLFSLSARRTWVFALPSLQWQLSGLFIAALIWALVYWQVSWRSLLVAGISMIAHSLALGSGLFIGVTFTIAIILYAVFDGQQSKRKERLLIFGCWTCICVIWFWLYLSDNYISVNDPALIGRSALLIFTSWLTYLGAPIIWFAGGRACALLGVASFFLLGFIGLRLYHSPHRMRIVAVPWVLLVFHIALLGAVTAYGRATDTEALTTARYTLESALYWVGIFVLWMLAWPEKMPDCLTNKSKRKMAAIALCTVILFYSLYAQSTRKGFAVLVGHSRNQAIARQAILQEKTVDDATINVIFPIRPRAPQRGRELLQQWLVLKGNFQSQGPPYVRANSQNAIGRLEWAGATAYGGYAFVPGMPHQRVSVDIYIDGKKSGSLVARWYRPDLSTLSNGQDEIGFRGDIAPKLSPGSHVIRVFYSDTNRELEGSPQRVFVR